MVCEAGFVIIKNEKTTDYSYKMVSKIYITYEKNKMPLYTKLLSIRIGGN